MEIYRGLRILIPMTSVRHHQLGRVLLLGAHRTFLSFYYLGEQGGIHLFDDIFDEFDAALDQHGLLFLWIYAERDERFQVLLINRAGFLLVFEGDFGDSTLLLDQVHW